MATIVKKIHFILLICCVCSIPFSLGEIKLNSYFIILLTINFFLQLIFLRKESKRSFNALLFLFIGVYFMHLLGWFKADNSHEAIFELQKKASIFLFPFLLCYSTSLTFEQCKTILLSFVFGCLLAVVICLSKAGYLFMVSGDSSVFFYQNLSWGVGMHATYLSMCLCFSIIILLFYFGKMTFNHKKQKLLYYSTLIIFGITILLLGARMQQLILFLIIIIYFFMHFHRSMGLLKSLVSVGVIAVAIMGLVLLFPSNREHFK